MDKILKLDIFKESILYAILIQIFLSLAFYLYPFSQVFSKFLNLIVLAIFLWAPGSAIAKYGYRTREFALEKIGLKKIKHDSYFLLLFIIFILIPYAGFYILFMFFKSKIYGLNFIFNFSLPDNFFYQILIQTIVIALPEEFFYRGFLQHSLKKKLSLSKSIILTNIFFALGHLAGFYWYRLLTFFPGLLFSYLTHKTKSIYAAIVFHALCNLAEQILILSIYE